MASRLPIFDAWVEKLRKATAGRGAINEPAALLAKHLRITEETARVRIQRILAGTEPRAGTFMILDGWMSPEKSKPQRRDSAKN